MKNEEGLVIISNDQDIKILRDKFMNDDDSWVYPAKDNKSVIISFSSDHRRVRYITSRIIYDFIMAVSPKYKEVYQ